MRLQQCPRALRRAAESGLCEPKHFLVRRASLQTSVSFSLYEVQCFPTFYNARTHATQYLLGFEAFTCFVRSYSVFLVSVFLWKPKNIVHVAVMCTPRGSTLESCPRPMQVVRFWCLYTVVVVLSFRLNKRL